MSHPHEDDELLEAAAANSLGGSQSIAGGGGATIEAAAANWTELDCGWLEEVRHIQVHYSEGILLIGISGISSLQNHFYWSHTNPVLLLGLYAAVCSFGALA